jgi:hypothetical protein
MKYIEQGYLKLYETQYKDSEVEIRYAQVKHGLWRIFTKESTEEAWSNVGPHYKTKSELVQDISRYAQDSWGFQ